MKLQRGSLVRCDDDFSLERNHYQYNYPHRNDYLIVSGLVTHNPTGQLLCTFEELSIPVPLAADFFTELQTPDEGNAIIRSIKNFLTK